MLRSAVDNFKRGGKEPKSPQLANTWIINVLSERKTLNKKSIKENDVLQTTVDRRTPGWSTESVLNSPKESAAHYSGGSTMSWWSSLRASTPFCQSRNIISVPENGGSLRAITDMRRTNDCVLHILTGQSSNGQRETHTDMWLGEWRRQGDTAGTYRQNETGRKLNTKHMRQGLCPNSGTASKK